MECHEHVCLPLLRGAKDESVSSSLFDFDSHCIGARVGVRLCSWREGPVSWIQP